jgi:AraC family transcriptional regulator of adaptative response/methylated-DNA-[protein]-cysteine methyltransferase
VARDEAAVMAAVKLLKQAQGPVPLADLAGASGYSPTHFQRLFTRLVGLSPAAYARALRQERAGSALSGGGRVTDVVYEAGYSAPSRFYAEAGRLGMAPSAWRDGGRGVTIRWAVAATTLGPLLIAATDKGVCRVAFGEEEADLRARFPGAELGSGDAAFARLVQRVADAVEQPGRSHAIPLDVQGTAFQQAVWQQLQRIPAGETRSYGEIAAAIGKPGAVRATGSANGANSVAVLIPCHRVVRADGSLGGYAWGEEIKRELLRREAVGDQASSRT